MSWTYYTAERMQWSRWTRKRRRKFKKRYFKQTGHRFLWFIAECKFVPLPFDSSSVVFFQRNSEVGLGATLKDG